jgi:hypothetical protein
MFSGGIRVKVVSSGDFTVEERARGGVADLVYLLLLKGCNPMEVGIRPPSFGFKDFHHAARLQSPVGSHLEG